MQQVFGRSGPITVLTSPFAAVSAAATAEAAAAAAAVEAADDKRMEVVACGTPVGQESSSDASHQTNGQGLGCVSCAILVLLDTLTAAVAVQVADWFVPRRLAAGSA